MPTSQQGPEFGSLDPRMGPPPAIPEALGDAIKAIGEKAEPKQLMALQEALSGYVVTLRASGYGIVFVIVRVRTALRGTPGHLIERAVTWSIQEYYSPVAEGE